MAVIININSMRSGVRSMAAVWILAGYVGAQPLPKFLGRQVTIIEPEHDLDGFPKGPARICLEGPPKRLCYIAPSDYGANPQAIMVPLRNDLSALLFSAASGGISGIGIHFALLRPGDGKDLENLFPDEVEVSNQGEHEFWSEPAISDAPIFLTADYVWGPDEAHYDSHRYIVSAYVLKHTSLPEGSRYYLEDRFMTVRKFDYEQDKIRTAEKAEILARLRRSMTGRKPRKSAPE